VTPLATLTASSTDTPTSTTRPALTRHGTHFQRHRVPWLLINNVEVILDADLHIGSAGLLRGGAVAWVQVEMADTLSAAGVEFRPFLTATTSNPDVSEVWLLDGHFFSEGPKSNVRSTPCQNPSLDAPNTMSSGGHSHPEHSGR
jgi:hypothetical protein